MIYLILVYIALVLGFIPLFLGLLNKEVVFTKQYLGYLPLIVLTALASGYELVFSYCFQINSNYWFQLYAILEFVAIYYFFKNLLPQRLNRYLIAYLSLFLLVYFYTFLFIFPINMLQSKAITKVTISFFVFGATLYWLAQLFKTRSIVQLYNKPVFYFIVGLFMYYLNTIFFFVLIQYVYSLNLNLYDYWVVNVIATLFYRITLIIGVWKMIYT